MAKRGLGKGISAVFEEIGSETKETSAVETELKITDVEPNKDQPRKIFDEEQLKSLSDSIKEHGVIQPILVQSLENGFYKIIAGERRWRAAKLAGLKTIPAIVRKYSEQQIMEIALIENLQREDLNPIEEAKGYKLLMETFEMTQEKISERVGKSRSAVANSLRLLTLSKKIITMLEEGKITSGHARALLSTEDKIWQEKLSEKIVSEGLSVRQTEKLAKNPPKEKEKTETSADIIDISEQLAKKLGTKVNIVQGKKKGKVEIEYYDIDQLNEIIRLIVRK